MNKPRWMMRTFLGTHQFILTFVLCFSLIVVSNKTVTAIELPDLERQFGDVVLPVLKKHCYDCHGVQKQEGQLNLSGDKNIELVIQNFRTWEIVLERLAANEMPPKSSPDQPTAESRRAVIDWIKSLGHFEAERHAGDPGTVLARRLSHAELDYTIRDLTGVDIRPTREFPVDPVNEAGFDNSGESLTMSPALVKKYLQAARHVADHLVLTPKGIVFAPHPVVAETDRDKYCVQQIVSFYERHQVDYADYFCAAWQYQNRKYLGRPDATLSDFANDLPGKDSSLSPRYLATIWSALNEPIEIGPVAELQVEWKKIADNPSLIELLSQSAPTKETERNQSFPRWYNKIHRECERLRDLVLTMRKGLDSNIEKLHVKGNSDGSQPLVLWWNRQIAARRMKYSGDGKDPTLDTARDRFCQVFPNRFAVTSRGLYADPNLGSQVRLLTAGFHLMQGYFRDDEPLCELVLDDSQKAELDSLWQNLNFVTLVPIRQYKDFLFFERAEPPQFAGGPDFDFARPENKDVTSESKLKQMRDAYLAKVRLSDTSDAAIEAVETYFANMLADVRWIEQTFLESQPSHLEAIVEFAERAYRRPLLAAERDELLNFYHSLRNQSGLSHEDAIRDSVVSILMSPNFYFRFDLSGSEESSRPLNDYELASRLSYFLWSSMPDQSLHDHAKNGDLHRPEVLMSEARRMLRDKRVRGLATEFAGHWLDFRRFEEHNSVDRDRFESFTNELRQAMYEEPLQLFMAIASQNRSVLEFVEADYTFVNPILAKHYGIKAAFDQTHDAATLSDRWVRIDHAAEYGRGGLLPMSVFLTANSPGLRTSPVKRGYWVVRKLLGEHIPPPPPSVPELPKDERDLGDLTLPQLLARHRNHQACAVCHDRFDGIGLAFEGYGPIGERREKDLGGNPINSKATFPDHTEGDGLPGLLAYLKEQRRNEFLENLCRKMLSYALGRSLILSDQITINKIRTQLAANEFRFESLIEEAITCPQFLNKRQAK